MSIGYARPISAGKNVSQPEFDKFSKSYSENIGDAVELFGKDHDFFVRNKADTLLSAFGSSGMDSSKLQVLDIGCGVGLVHRYIKNAVGSVHGTDVSGASLDIARTENPDIAYDAYDGVNLPYPDASFDVAYAICVLHHVPVPQWQKFVDEMRRVVRPGGQILLIEHNPLNPATQFVVRNAPMDENAVLVWPRRLRALMRAAGLLEPDTRYILFTPFEGGFFRRLDRLLKRVPLGTQYVMEARV
jgi:ubiquinone/menaquinone biosynthesis C-methylase UbiE